MLELLEREIKFGDGARRASRIQHEPQNTCYVRGYDGKFAATSHHGGQEQRSKKCCMGVVSVERCGAVNEQLRGGKDL